MLIHKIMKKLIPDLKLQKGRPLHRLSLIFCIGGEVNPVGRVLCRTGHAGCSGSGQLNRTEV